MKVVYTGTADFQEFSAADFQKADIEDQKKVVFAKGEPTEVSDAAAEALTSNEGLFAGHSFELDKDDSEDDSAEETPADDDESSEVEEVPTSTPEAFPTDELATEGDEATTEGTAPTTAPTAGKAGRTGRGSSTRGTTRGSA